MRKIVSLFMSVITTVLPVWDFDSTLLVLIVFGTWYLLYNITIVECIDLLRRINFSMSQKKCFLLRRKKGDRDDRWSVRHRTV